ncbi:MAG: hypothetical protein KF819_28865, partial [Labilithrix sp.]|nr:hypothetical protein [Labilithrix sp.]
RCSRGSGVMSARRLALFAFAIAIASCGQKMKGSLRATLDGTPVEIKSAFVVPHGGRSFRVSFSSDKRDCDWARRSGTGTINGGEVLGSFDVAPVVGADGAAKWTIVGAGWVADSKRSPIKPGNVGSVSWPAEVKAAEGCAKRIKVDSHEGDVVLVGDFEATCCDEAAGAVVTTGPMTLRLGAETFPLAQASAKKDRDGWALRISRTLEPCTDEVTHEDVFVNLNVDPELTKALSANVVGMVVPTFGYRADVEVMPAVSRVGAPGKDQIKIDGKVRLRPFMSFEGQTLEGELHGQVPIVYCPPK